MTVHKPEYKLFAIKLQISITICFARKIKPVVSPRDFTKHSFWSWLYRFMLRHKTRNGNEKSILEMNLI